jgi:hypothetical protein
MSCIYLEILSKIYISIGVYRKVRQKQSKKTPQETQLQWSIFVMNKEHKKATFFFYLF